MIPIQACALPITKAKTIIASFVDDASHTVLIAHIFHGGRDYEAALRG